MNIGFVVNGLTTEVAGYTTTHLAMAATNRGHEAWYVNVEDFSYDPDENVRAWVHLAAPKKYRSPRRYLDAVRGEHAIRKRVSMHELDILFLRNDPSEDVRDRPWARLAGINFGRFAMRHGVLVLNDPDGLARAVNKLYLHVFPEEVRPKTLITRMLTDIKQFAKEYGTVVLKPLYGSGGRSVFLCRPEDRPNMNQMIETVSRDGYVIVQQYLPKAVEGDTRLFLLNGKPFIERGHYAVLRRIRSGGDMRSNMSAGATSAKATINDDMLQIAAAVEAQLMTDGMFFVGLDIVGDKLMEINVFSPGGLESAEHFEGVNFSQALIKDLERKVAARGSAVQPMSNLKLATF